MPGISAQKTVIDACIQASVKRYIPSDFGGFSTDPTAESLNLHVAAQDIQKYLKQKASRGEIDYTVFAVGCFLEYVISMPFIVDVHKHTIDLYDNGLHAFSSTSVASIGKAVAGALKNAQSTKNRVIRVHDIVLTQAKVLGIAKKYSAPVSDWRVNVIDASAEIERLVPILKQSKGDVGTWFALLKAAILSGKFAADYTPPDNDLVGLALMSESEFEKRYAEGYQSVLYDFAVEAGDRFAGHI